MPHAPNLARDPERPRPPSRGLRPAPRSHACAESSSRRSLPLVAVLALLACLGGSTAPARAAELPIRIEVDATELSRSLLRSRVEIPVAPGPAVFWYPKWVPGIHGPGGPVENLGGLRFETPTGESIPWRRDDEQLHRFHVVVPEGVERIVARIDYIANQPSVNSEGVDCYGSPNLGVVNWNCAFVYPEGPTASEIMADVSLRIPEGWGFGVDLEMLGVGEQPYIFAPVSLAELVDRPLVCGRYFRSIELETGEAPPATLHLATETEAALRLPDDLVKAYGELIRQGWLMFGGAPFEHYHFLVTCSDVLPRMGLEHRTCSLNGVGERELIDEEQRKGWAAYLLPHEFVHAWCGKYRRPAGMATPDFHAAARTELLWVYEGLAQYLGEVLTVRAGILSADEYRDRLTWKLGSLMLSDSRSWRTLEDTATASHSLRAFSRKWGMMRGGQDYYDEGLHLWMEADARIRDASDGRFSLDDFCRGFFAVASDAPTLHPFTREELVEALGDLGRTNWTEFFDGRVRATRDALPLDVVRLLGYTLRYEPEPSEFVKKRERDRGTVVARSSLGVDFSSAGRVGEVVQGSAADRAGLAPGMEIVGVDGRKFSATRIKDAIAASVSTRKIELLALEGDVYRTIVVEYDGGPRYMELKRDESRQDTLAAILAPRKPAAPTAPPSESK